jgi:hypothetical protein
MNAPVLSRRTLIRGLGTALALPFLESMVPSRRLLAASISGAAPTFGPRRLAWFYVPNGVVIPNWFPTTVGRDFALSPTLQPLAPFRDKLTVISGLVCDKANPNGDGPGDHARAQAAYLTGVQPRKTGGANIKLGVSADQAVAAKVGHLTKFPSLELGIEEGKQVGVCDSGYSCAYSHSLSWRGESTPVVKDCNPQSVFDRLFAAGDPGETAEARARRENDRKSVLDFVLGEANAFTRTLGAADRQKMDEYLTSVREIELRLASTVTPAAPPAGAERPAEGKPREYPDHAKLMLDMTVLAFQADLTRVITFPFADEGSDRTYPWADANVRHHTTSHHQNDPAKLELLSKINVFHMELFAYFLQRLDVIKEGNGSILDNSLITYGSGNSDGNRHNHDNIPLILLGKGGGTVSGGQHVRFDGQPLNNLWLSLMDRMGASYDRLGDSTGRVALS